MISIKCETEPVANNEKFAALVNDTLDAAIAAGAKTVAEVLALPLYDSTVEEQIKVLSGVTGEKMEMGEYAVVEGVATVAYNHFNKKLSTIVAFNNELDEEVAKTIAMQVASMNPIVATRDQIDQAKIDEEYNIAVEKTKAEQVKKAVDNALKKAGFNAYYCETEEHMDEALRKGYMTEEDLAKAKQIKEETAEAKKANMPEQMIQNIANGRLNKFFAENVLMEQEVDADGVEKMTVANYLKKFNKDLAAIDMKRVNLNAD